MRQDAAQLLVLEFRSVVTAKLPDLESVLEDDVLIECFEGTGYPSLAFKEVHKHRTSVLIDKINRIAIAPCDIRLTNRHQVGMYHLEGVCGRPAFATGADVCACGFGLRTDGASLVG